MAENEQELRHTGIWPFNLFPSQPQAAAQSAQAIAIFDPIALAFNAGSRLTKAGWIGLELMPTAFLWKVVDAKPEEVEALVSEWLLTHHSTVADVYEERLTDYTFDPLAKTAMSEALSSYRAMHFLSAVRTLMPEFERFGRMVAKTDGTLPKNQKEAVTAIQEYLGGLPAGRYSPIESLSAFHLITEDLFARCLTQQDAQNLGTGPNRHAELHGLASYGNLQGATKMLCAVDFMLSSVNLAISQQAKPKK
jgi:hypothetical protein